LSPCGTTVGWELFHSLASLQGIEQDLAVFVEIQLSRVSATNPLPCSQTAREELAGGGRLRGLHRLDFAFEDVDIFQLGHWVLEWVALLHCDQTSSDAFEIERNVGKRATAKLVDKIVLGRIETVLGDEEIRHRWNEIFEVRVPMGQRLLNACRQTVI
jgi:hypothetical protein